MITHKKITSDLLFDALINAPVTDKEWAEALVDCASKYKTMCSAMHKVFRLEGLSLSFAAWEKIKEAAQRLNPKPPEFLYKSCTAMVFICDNFVNASLCIFANKPEEAVNWILSGKDKKRIVMPKKKTGIKRQAHLIIKFRERDDSTAWNKCK
jgi:hypothetical protein